jgi:putative membrane protein
MEAIFNSLITGLPFLLLHSSVTFAMLAAGLIVYAWITPYDELALIKAGNTAAAITLSGAVIGFAIPLAVTLKTSLNLWDIVLWGLVTLFLMLISYRVMDFVIRDFEKRVEKDETGPAILVAAVKIAVGLIAAASVAG